MKKVLLTLCTLVFALGLSLGEAQAARLGGGKSLGMQRQSVAPQRAPAQQATPAQPATPAAAPAPAAPKRNWLGPVAGLTAGLGLAALASHLGFGAGLANFLTIALLAMAAVFVFKWLARRNAAAPTRDALQYSAAGEAASPVAAKIPLAVPAASSAEPITAKAIPADFDSEAFVRVAKLNFVRLQAANDAGNIDDIREFVAPELFAEIKLQIDERGSAPQQTDVVTLNAELLEVVSEERRHVASVRFSGMLREAPGTAAQPFAEIWNLAKPLSGQGGWVIAGIQQVD